MDHIPKVKAQTRYNKINQTDLLPQSIHCVQHHYKVFVRCELEDKD